MLFINTREEDEASHVVSLSSHPQRFLDVIKSRNINDKKLHDAALVSFEERE
jgi:hypothetical protein